MQQELADSTDEESRLAVLDPRAKLVGLLSLAAVSPLLASPLALAASAAVAILLFLVSGLRPRRVAKGLVLPLPFAVFAFISIWPFRGLLPSTLVAARIMICVTFLTLLSAATPFFQLIGALRYFGFPAIMTQILLLMYRYIFLLSDEMRRMSTARKARGFSGARHLLDRRGLSILSSTAGMIIYRSYVRGRAVTQALLARRYDGGMPISSSGRLRRVDLLFVASCFAAAATLASLQVGVV